CDMEHDLSHYRDNLVTVPCYAANNALYSSVSWLAQRTGDILINTESNQNTVISVVGCVLDNRLDCTAIGNLGNRAVDKLPTTKYHLLLAKPTDTIFLDDFHTAIENLEKVEKKIGSTKNFQNLIVDDCDGRILRFTCPVFETRSPPISGLSGQYLITFGRRWLKSNILIVPSLWALIEIHFELRHYAIKGTTTPLNSFNANIEQIIIIQPGKARPPTAYKRSTDEDGPIRMNPIPPALQHESVSAGQLIEASTSTSTPLHKKAATTAVNVTSLSHSSIAHVQNVLKENDSKTPDVSDNDHS
ncbi:hypothetical protein V8E53_003707, partial [Lactarius tabidus]